MNGGVGNVLQFPSPLTLLSLWHEMLAISASAPRAEAPAARSDAAVAAGTLSMFRSSLAAVEDAGKADAEDEAPAVDIGEGVEPEPDDVAFASPSDPDAAGLGVISLCTVLFSPRDPVAAGVEVSLLFLSSSSAALCQTCGLSSSRSSGPSCPLSRCLRSRSSRFSRICLD